MDVLIWGALLVLLPAVLWGLGIQAIMSLFSGAVASGTSRGLREASMPPNGRGPTTVPGAISTGATVGASSTASKIEQLEKLTLLLETGTVTRDEFDRMKGQLIGAAVGPPAPLANYYREHLAPLKSDFVPPFYRRRWFVILMCCTLGAPIAFLLAASGPVFWHRNDGWTEVSGTGRFIYILWSIIWTAGMIAANS